MLVVVDGCGDRNVILKENIRGENGFGMRVIERVEIVRVLKIKCIS